MDKTKVCPACGFLLWFEPWYDEVPSFEICTCCGIQFGLTDFGDGTIEERIKLYQEWQDKWIKAGMP